MPTCQSEPQHGDGYGAYSAPRCAMLNNADPGSKLLHTHKEHIQACAMMHVLTWAGKGKPECDFIGMAPLCPL